MTASLRPRPRPEADFAPRCRSVPFASAADSRELP